MTQKDATVKSTKGQRAKAPVMRRTHAPDRGTAKRRLRRFRLSGPSNACGCQSSTTTCTDYIVNIEQCPYKPKWGLSGIQACLIVLVSFLMEGDGLSRLAAQQVEVLQRTV